MKLKIGTFNKIIGTEFRVKNIINLYVSVACWLIDNKETSETKFRQWAKESGIYNYNTQQKILRLNMLKQRILKKFKLIKETNDGKYKFNCKIDEIKNYILNSLTKIDGLEEKRDIEPCIAFKAMLDFMIANPNLNDAKKIYHSFRIYENNDDFLQLYNSDIIEKIVNYNVGDGEGYQVIFDISNGKIIRKPMNIKPICKKIINNKINFTITNEEFYKAKKTFLTNFDSKIKFENFVKNNTYDKIAKVIIGNSVKRNFNYEFFDLFNRLLFSLDICPSTGTKVTNYFNHLISKNNDRYIILPKNRDLVYPYTLSETNHILTNINEKKYDFIQNDINLCQIPIADVCEYFVNIKFCYLKNIMPKDAKLWINTILDEKLYPISHAPGGHSDMNLIENNTMWSIETTLHDTIPKIIKNELYSSIDHILKHKQNKKNNILLLVTHLPLKHYNDLIKKFINYATYQFKEIKKNFELKTYNFEQLSQLKQLH